MTAWEIERETWTLIRRLGLHDSLPLATAALCRRLGIAVSRHQLSDPTLSGLVLVEAETASIFIDPRPPLLHQRLAVAHALGHFWLHLRSAEDGGFRDTAVTVGALGSVADPAEQEAIAFATCLLMPAPSVRCLYRGPDDLPRLAPWFAVSRGRLAIRGRGLGL